MASPDGVWLVDFADPYPGEPAFHRPALLLGPAREFGDGLPFVIVAPLTTVDRRLSFHVELEADLGNGLTETSYVQCELLRSISRKRLRRSMGMISLAQSASVASVVRLLLGYDSLMNERPTFDGLLHLGLNSDPSVRRSAAPGSVRR